MNNKISIIIVNYNTFKTTTICIRSILQFTKDVNFEIILVDNASSECDASLFNIEFQDLIIIKNSCNDGFAKGNNLGIQASTGNIILLLNSDTILVENSIKLAAEYLNKHKNIGSLTCKMVFENGQLQYPARCFRNPTWEILDLIRPILYLLPYKKRAEYMQGKYFKSDFNLDCDWVNGAFFMFKKELLEALPDKKLDDRFFMYGEDQLWCYQFSKLGYKSHFLSETKIIHINNGSTDISKRLSLRKVMNKHELEILKVREKSNGFILMFKLIYFAKENIRNAIKFIIFKLFGKLIN